MAGRTESLLLKPWPTSRSNMQWLALELALTVNKFARAEDIPFMFSHTECYLLFWGCLLLSGATVQFWRLWRDAVHAFDSVTRQHYALQATAGVTSAALEATTEECEARKSDCADLQLALDSSGDMISSLTQENAALMSGIDDLQRENKTLQEVFKSNTRTIALLTVKCRATESTIITMSRELDQLQSRVAAVLSERNLLQQSLIAVNEECNRYRQECGDLEKTVASQQEAIASTRQLLNRECEASEMLRYELNSVNVNFDEQSSKMNDLEEKYILIVGEAAKLQVFKDSWETEARNAWEKNDLRDEECMQERKKEVCGAFWEGGFLHTVGLFLRA